MSLPSETLDDGAPRDEGLRAGESLPDDSKPYCAGDIIAQKYQLARLLGEGGMGAVWLARNLKLEVDVAIKLIRSEQVSESTADRLLQEARAAARIGHRSIVRVFDFGETELGDPFIVMEMLTGESLRALIDRKGRLPATQAVRTLLPIASALVEAHASGIVHRDLKPENVMLVPDAAGGIVPKLLDFGIAQFRRSDDDAVDSSRGGMVSGTPAYMSPEQMGGREALDEGADVWALAVMLYEAMTGHVPFVGSNHAALMFAVMTEEPTPTTDELAGDTRLWGILHDALAKQTSGRPSVRDFGKALAQWAIDSGVDSDVAGASLAAHWVDDTRHPYSGLPPPVAPNDGTPSSVVVPKAAPLPRGMMVPTEAPPTAAASRPSNRAIVWLSIAGMVGIATLVIVTGRGSGNVAPRTAPDAAATAAAASAPPNAPSADPKAASDPAPRVTAITAATADALPTPAPLAAPAVDTPAAAGSAVAPRAPRKPVRKSTLPIAKHPNF